MAVAEQLDRLWGNLLGLGGRRLAALGIIGLAVFATTGLAGYFLSRPTFDTLYAGLDRQDVTRIGAALREAGIAFDVNAEGTTVLVRYGETSQARMLLAEKGLPHSSSSGYELFDKLGSLGLTSFMQEVTRVRALEGELARTIQSIKGIKAARVHIVLPDEGSFRRTRQPPSASVVLRSDVSDGSGSSQAIRHLVAAAVPGMTVDQVTVMNSDGVLLSSTSEGADAAPGRALTLEKQVSQDIRDKITKTLGPYLSARNFQVSVAARLNTDKKQVSETTYNPESRVERSVRVVRENQVSHNTTSQPTTTVERNIPQDRERPADGKQSNEENQKREELTNYEVSSKSTTTVSAGYSIENLSVAVLVNRAGIAGSLGEKATPEVIERQLAEVEQLVASAAGLRRDRGDVIKISAVEFTNEGRDLEPVVSPGLGEMLARQSGTAINAATALVVAFLLIWFGIRPATKALLAPPALPHGAGVDLLPGPELAALPDGEPRVQVGTWEEANLIEDLTSKPRRSPQKRLEQMVQFDEEQAAAILKQWLHGRERV
jgi:flagellar M-ring protein FliF